MLLAPVRIFWYGRETVFSSLWAAAQNNCSPNGPIWVWKNEVATNLWKSFRNRVSITSVCVQVPIVFLPHSVIIIRPFILRLWPASLSLSLSRSLFTTLNTHTHTLSLSLSLSLLEFAFGLRGKIILSRNWRLLSFTSTLSLSLSLPLSLSLSLSSPRSWGRTQVCAEFFNKPTFPSSIEKVNLLQIRLK